jgi:hypothetical protein
MSRVAPKGSMAAFVARGHGRAPREHGMPCSACADRLGDDQTLSARADRVAWICATLIADVTGAARDGLP